MKYRRLGKTGLQVSVIGVGAWQFGGEWGIDFTPAEVEAILKAAGDAGINLIDTAECYGDHLSERLIGAAIKGQRDRWVIATKFGHKFHDKFERTDHWSPEEVRQQLEDSLRALETDYIDVYQAHGDRITYDDRLWTMLEAQVQAGKIRHLGISISDNRNAASVANAPLFNVQTIQVVYNRLDRNPETVIFPACRAQDLGVLARVPLASGLLSGKYRPGATFTETDDVRSRRSPEEIQQQLAEVERIKAEEVPAGVEMAQWALAWCLRHPAVTAVIPGVKSAQQAQINAQAADLVELGS